MIAIIVNEDIECNFCWLNNKVFGLFKMEKNSSKSIVFKKDFFIKTRKEDIRQVYEFSPKVTHPTRRSSAGEPMALSTRPGINSHRTPTE